VREEKKVRVFVKGLHPLLYPPPYQKNGGGHIS
jgi:hypothetical protein